MKPRDQTLPPHPDTGLFLTCTLPGYDVEHVFRSPSMLVGMELFEAIDQTVLLAFVAATGEALTIGTLMHVVKNGGPDVIRALGYLIGVSWQHPTNELETVRGADLLTYGAAVFEELHGAGYSMQDITMMALCIASHWMQRNAVDAEAIKKAGFFPPLAGGETSPPLT